MEKVVVLNSGGFDSTVLIHYVKENYPDTEIHSLHFSYGQRSAEEELKWSEYNAKKVGAVIKNISLPPFDWTKSNFYKDGYEYETQYLEWRNLVFLSYALSYARAEKINKIFCAILKSRGYNDTSKKFLRTFNLFDDIEVITPFDDYDKYDLIPIAFELGIEPNSFHSCDVGNIPCGNCLDCITIDEVNKELKLDSPIKIYRHCGNNADCDEFRKLIKNTVAWELRVLWNDDCQLNCTHCFYNSKMKNERISYEKFLDVVKQAFELGIPSIHIGGKEPLFDDSIINFIRDINELRKNYSDIKHPYLDINGTFLSLVTNGINLPKYIKNLKKSGLDKVFISVDDVLGIESDLIRITSKEIAFNAIDSAIDSDIDLEVFIDIHSGNFNKLPEIIYTLECKGVTNFYIRTLKAVGNGKDIERLNIKQFENVVFDLINYSPKNLNTHITLAFGIYYTNLIYGQSPQLSNLLVDSLYSGISNVTNCLSIMPEFFCSTYLEQITLTPDGSILGCALDISRPDYDVISAGNIKHSSLKEIIEIGKATRNFRCNNFNYNPNCLIGCPHEFGI